MVFFFSSSLDWMRHSWKVLYSIYLYIQTHSQLLFIERRNLSFEFSFSVKKKWMAKKNNKPTTLSYIIQPNISLDESYIVCINKKCTTSTHGEENEIRRAEAKQNAYKFQPHGKTVLYFTCCIRCHIMIIRLGPLLFDVVQLNGIWSGKWHISKRS